MKEKTPDKISDMQATSQPRKQLAVVETRTVVRLKCLLKHWLSSCIIPLRLAMEGPQMQVSQVSRSGAAEVGSLLSLGGGCGDEGMECAAAAAGLWNDVDGSLLGMPGQVSCLL